MKARNQELVEYAILQQIQGKIKYPVSLKYTFFEINKRRDLDNISSFAHKVIQDAFVTTKRLPNDGWNEIIHFEDFFEVDKENPRIEVEIEELKV